MTTWMDTPTHHAWLDAECRRLLEFGLRAGLPEGGAAYLDTTGAPDLTHGVATWLTARALHVYSIGDLLGIPGSGRVADAALAGLTGRLRDAERGGWYAGLLPDGTPDVAQGKVAYAHAFVMLGASSAVIAGRAGADDLLREATEVFLTHFWDEEVGRVIDTWDLAFSASDDYRGLNSLMHSVEAMISVADAVGDPAEADAWRRRAARAVGFVIDLAAAHEWRMPEHFGPDWTPRLELNREQPDDPFKPFGATPGHGFEWARLMLHLEAALGSDVVGGTVLDAARRLFDRGVEDAWSVDGADGFIYTTDWDGSPVVRQRMHWVVAEAIGTAAALYERTGDARYGQWYARFWDYAACYLIDLRDGSWFHELDAANAPAATVWPGKPDLYHTVQATLVPRLPLAPTFARAVAEGLLPSGCGR